MIIHNVGTWFPNTTVLEYFNTKFESNVSGKFKFPRKILSQWLEDDIKVIPKALQENVINAIANVAIQSITTSVVSKFILPKIPFAWLMEDTAHWLRQAVCEYILNACNNDQFFERLNGSTMTSSAFTMTQDTTNWLLQSDALGIATKNAIDMSGIVNYQVFESESAWLKNNGNVYIIGTLSDKLVKELML